MQGEREPGSWPFIAAILAGLILCALALWLISH